MIKPLSVVAMLALGQPASAQNADLDVIDRAVAQFAGADIGSPGGAAQPVDRRLRLRSCAAPIALDWHGTSRATVRVACPVPGGWRIFVPLTVGTSAPDLAPLVAKGDAVTVTVSGDGFAVSQQGEALEAGAEGQWIKVRMGRGDLVRARVLRPGAVGIALP